jgi:formylmethanofuran dehydrogenase subunit C
MSGESAMKEIRLNLRKKPSFPLEAESISPDLFIGKQPNEIEELPIYLGNTKLRLIDFFEITGETSRTISDQLIVVEGETSLLKYIGLKMTGGKILVNGSAGMHVGAQMVGGEILVKGSVGDWAGAEMKGGLLRITGNAGNNLGSAYRGSSEGMTGGCIVVDEDVGWECGSFLRRGMIVIRGDAAPFMGAHLNGGEIFVFGESSKRMGASAKGNGGFIACFGEVEKILPTYVFDSIYKPIFMKLYLRQIIDDLGIVEANKFMETSFKRYHGDLAVGGTSEILVVSF